MAAAFSSWRVGLILTRRHRRRCLRPSGSTTANLRKEDNAGHAFLFSFRTSCKSKKSPDKTVAHLPDLQPEVERIQAQRSCLPDWPSGKPTLVLPGLILEQAQAGQRHDIVTTDREVRDQRQSGREERQGRQPQKHT